VNDEEAVSLNDAFVRYLVAEGASFGLQTQTLSFSLTYTLCTRKLCVITYTKALSVDEKMEYLLNHCSALQHTHTQNHLPGFHPLTILTGWLRAGKSVREDFT